MLLVLLASLMNTHAQPLSTDTLARVRCANVVVMPPFALEFDILLANRSRTSAPLDASWQHWANGTFMLNVQNVNLLNARCVLDSSDLPLVAPVNTPSGSISRNGYEVKIRVQPAQNLPSQPHTSQSRIAIAFLGADSLQQSFIVPQGMERLLGRFRVEFVDSLRTPNDVRLEWVSPLDRFQANAFKVAQNLRVQGVELQTHDNCEMTTLYTTEAASVELPPFLTASGFTAEYAGDKRVRLQWRTSAERTGRRTNAGFVLLRRIITPIAETRFDTTRFDTIAHFRTHPRLRLRGVQQGSLYEFTDSVRSRGDIVQYRLLAEDATPRRMGSGTVSPFQVTFARDTASTLIPNAVIVRAVAEPNPFTSESHIRYELQDRARITATLYDVLGRVIMLLAENREEARGTHTLTLNTNALAVQGALLLVLQAVPTDDAAVEKSETVLKLQRVR